MKKTLLLSAVSLLAVSGLAWAGSTRSRETQVDLTTRRATGSVYDTRMSADTVQYIGCMVYGTAGNLGVWCDAMDAESERLNCGSADDALASLALGISDSSFISFACDANSNLLTNLAVTNGSMWLP